MANLRGRELILADGQALQGWHEQQGTGSRRHRRLGLAQAVIAEIKFSQRQQAREAVLQSFAGTRSIIGCVPNGVNTETKLGQRAATACSQRPQYSGGTGSQEPVDPQIDLDQPAFGQAPRKRLHGPCG